MVLYGEQRACVRRLCGSGEQVTCASQKLPKNSLFHKFNFFAKVTNHRSAQTRRSTCFVIRLFRPIYVGCRFDLTHGFLEYFPPPGFLVSCNSDCYKHCHPSGVICGKRAHCFVDQRRRRGIFIVQCHPKLNKRHRGEISSLRKIKSTPKAINGNQNRLAFIFHVPDRPDLHGHFPIRPQCG